MISFFPTLDIGLSELTAALSSFQSADLLAGLPENLARFETMHESSGETYISLLENYCQKRRSDVNTIMTSLNIYRPEDRSADINNIAVKGGGSGGNGGGGGHKEPAGGANGFGDKEGGGNQVQHWSGGTPSSPGRCHICNLDNQTHLYFNCSLLETFKKNGKVKKGVCFLCLKPYTVCLV